MINFLKDIWTKKTKEQNYTIPDNPFYHTEEYEKMEIEADKFACNLLMPDDDFKAMFNRGLSIRELAIEYGVPIGAVALKMQMLGLYRI